MASKSVKAAKVEVAEATGNLQRRYSEELGLLRGELMSAEAAGTELHNHAVRSWTEFSFLTRTFLIRT